MELNEHERHIVELIGKLADAADDESTTQDTIDHIMENLHSKARENARNDMANAEKDMPEVKIPKVELDDEIERQERVHGENIPSPLLFTRVREVKSPCKAHPTDAGIDFFVPDAKAWDDDFMKLTMEMSRNPILNGYDGVEFKDGRLVVGVGAHVAIPSGIKTIIPPGLGMMFVNKSGIATKLKLDHSACLVDADYRDEIIMCFFNHGLQPVEIEPGMKITQGLIVPIIPIQLQEVLNCVYEDIGKASNRGGGFGSSNK